MVFNDAKVGQIRARDLPSVPSSVTLIREPDGRYYASFVVSIETSPLPPVAREAGIDLGLTTLAAIASTDGTVRAIANPRFLRRRERKLAQAQAALSRKVKGSANWLKARRRIAVIHRKVRETRRDHAHQTALQLIRENQAVHVEDLSIVGMARTRLGKSVHYAAWGQFVRLLEEKAIRYGRSISRVDRWFPSTRLCSACGLVTGPAALQVREWACVCGAVHHRDENAARNILAAGLAERSNACGGGVGPGSVPAAAVESGTPPRCRAGGTAGVRADSGGEEVN